MQVAAAADALLVSLPHPATPHMDLGASWTPHIDLAVMLLLRCFLEARSNSMGKWRSRNAQHRPLPAKFLWCARNILCVAHACGLSGFLCGQFLLVCVAMSRGFCVAMLGIKLGPRNQRARKPPAAPPRVVLPAELNCRGACEMFQFVCKREFVSWACMVDGSHKKREGECFFGD